MRTLEELAHTRAVLTYYIEQGHDVARIALSLLDELEQLTKEYLNAEEAAEAARYYLAVERHNPPKVEAAEEALRAALAKVPIR